MRLKIEREKCDLCESAQCMNSCPLFLEKNALNCIHCNPEEAECRNACRRNAFFEIAEGILSIDEEKCDGCGECVKACPYNAIVLVNGKARKCNLCAENDFLVSCAEGCARGAISIRWERKETRAAEKAFGWRVFPVKERNMRVLRHGNNARIVKCNGKKWYLLDSMPALTKQEAVLLRKILREFQEGKWEKGNLEEAVERHCSTNSIELGEEQKDYFLGVLGSSVYGFGPVSVLLEDEELEEIALAGLGKSNPLRAFHRDFGWLDCNAYFSSGKAVRNLVNKMIGKMERRLSTANPRVNGMLSDGSRLNATLPPVSVGMPSFTIRKFHTQKMTPLELVGNKTFSAELMAFLWLSMLSECSVLIAGNTGSGKTTTLNALFSFVPRDERIVVVEETPEMHFPHAHCVRLNTLESRNIKMQDLIADSLRMRPDRIVIGEVRERGEIKAFVDTLLAGQGKGSYATMHALSAREAVTRMKAFGARDDDLKGVDLFIVQKRWTETDLERNERREKRRITEVAELGEKGRAKRLFSLDFRRDRIKRHSFGKKPVEKMKIAFGLSKGEIEGKIKKRTLALEEWKSERLCLKEFFERACAFREDGK